MALSITWFTTVIIAVTVLRYIIFRFIKMIPFYKESWKYPGPLGLPFIGNAHYFIGDYFNKCQKLINTYPTPFCIWMGDQLYYVLNNVDQIKTVLSSQKAIHKADTLNFTKALLGSGLLLATEPKWRVHRKMIDSTLNVNILKSFIDVFVNQSNIMIKKMEVELNRGQFQIFDYISTCTLDFICETMMGISLHSQTESSQFVEATDRLLKIIHKRICTLWLHPDIIFNNTDLGKEHNKLIEIINNFTDDVIRKRKDFLMSNESLDNKEYGKKTFLDLLMEKTDKKNKFTDKELREEINDMILAGHYTSAIANCFVLLMLANHPEIQEKVFNESCTIFGNDDPCIKRITREDLSRMVYLECVIKETLRIFPIGPIIMRKLDDDLDIGSHTLLKGSGVVIGIMGVHRDEKYWENPLKFDPERFLPERLTKEQSRSYMPFSSGPRNCIGVKYAMMAMKTLLTTMIRNYIVKNDTIVPIPDMQLQIELVLKPVKPVTIKIEKRNYKIKHTN